MFPYGDNPNDFWTGYYVSRQSAKKFVRDGSAKIHAFSKMYSEKVIN